MDDDESKIAEGGAITIGAVAFAQARHRTRSWGGTPIELPGST